MEYNPELVSVIIPVYNVKPYLEECISSVRAQTYKELEIIIVDDGSTDGSGELCDAIKEKDNRILVIHKKNAGLGYARNSALDVFSGRYVTFVDSDDYIAPNMIEALYKGLKENKVDECKMGFQRVKNDRSVCNETEYKNEVFPGDEAKTKYAPRLIGSDSDKHDGIEMCVWGVIFNGDIIREHNLRFPSERELISEDLIFHLEYSQYANGACTITNTDYKYRVNEESLSKSYRTDRMEKSLFFYDEVIRRLKIYGYGENVVNRAKRILFVYTRTSISQEVTYKKNTIVVAVRNIKKICSNTHLLEIINSYPIREFGLPQRVFLECVKHKMGLALYILKKCGAY